MSPALLLVSLLLYLLIAMVWPTYRLWHQHRVWAVVFSREAAPGQRLLGRVSKALPVVLLLLTGSRVWISPEVLGEWPVSSGLAALGMCLQLLGTGLTVLAQLHLGSSWRIGIDDRPTALVTGGIFQWIRNPIFSGMLMFLAGVTCQAPSWLTLSVWAATAAGIRLQVSLEEQHLARQHGDLYRAYLARTGRFLPGLGRVTSRMQEVSD